MLLQNLSCKPVKCIWLYLIRLSVEVIVEVASLYYQVLQYFFHGTYRGTKSVVPPNTTKETEIVVAVIISYDMQ